MLSPIYGKIANFQGNFQNPCTFLLVISKWIELESCAWSQIEEQVKQSLAIRCNLQRDDNLTFASNRDSKLL